MQKQDFLSQVVSTFRSILLMYLLVSTPNFSLLAQLNEDIYPVLKNFPRSEYNAGMQTWMISQAPNDLMYFANNYGLLEFDGHNWDLNGFQNYTVARSVLAAENGITYIGLANDFGYFYIDSSGVNQFNSLLGFLPDSARDFEEIWRIHDTYQGVVFQTFNELIVFKDSVLSIYKAPNEFFLSFYLNNKLYVVDWVLGILEFRNGEFIPLKGTDVFPQTELNAIMPFGKDLMIATMGKGVFIYKDKKIEAWDVPINDFLIEHQIYCAIRIDENRIAFGTIQKGLVICDNFGSVIHKMDKSNGIQNNTILSMSLDKSGNLWLGTNNGIDLLYINKPISKLSLNGEIGSGYSSIIHKGYIYLGTNQGLYYKKLDADSNNNSFKAVKRLKGQVWHLKVIDDELFCGHNKGAYLVRGTEVKKIGKVPGTWLFLQSENNPNKIIAGSYTGLLLFEKIDGEWAYIKKLEGFSESSRLMYFDHNENLWMGHGYKGAYHIKLSENLDRIIDQKLYNSGQGFLNDFGINIAKVQGQIIFPTSEGIFQYNAKTDSIEASPYFNDFFGNESTSYAIEDSFGNIWYYGNHGLSAKLIKADGNYNEYSMPFKQLTGSFIEGFQHVYSVDESNFLICNENGYVAFNKDLNKVIDIPFNLYLNQVRLTKSNLTIFEGHLFSDKEITPPQIKFNSNSIQFIYSAVHFETPYKVEFSTYLEGYDKSWSTWQNNYDREFTNLREGRYVFHIKARNPHNIETPSVDFAFEILPPWYRTKYSYIGYGIFVLLLVLLVIYITRRRIAITKEKELEEQKGKYLERERTLEQDAIIAEQEIVRLRNDQLKEKIKSKDKELANSTMETIKKNKFLIGLKRDMQKNNAEMISETAKSQNKKLVRKIDNEINNEKNWQVFDMHFSNVHEEFLSILKQKYSQLSPADMRLCACLRMNISSKEIATLLNISLRGVEASRYRLRKALDLDRSINLTDFILTI